MYFCGEIDGYLIVFTITNEPGYAIAAIDDAKLTVSGQYDGKSFWGNFIDPRTLEIHLLGQKDRLTIKNVHLRYGGECEPG